MIFCWALELQSWYCTLLPRIVKRGWRTGDAPGMAEGRGVEVLTTEQGWRVWVGSLEENHRKSMPKNCELIWILEVDWNGLNVSKNNCFGDSGAVHALLGAISVLFWKGFFQLSQCSTHAGWFFSEHVSFYRRVSGWKRYYSASKWAMWSHVIQERDRRERVLTSVCQHEFPQSCFFTWNQPIRGVSEIGDDDYVWYF